MASPTVLFEQPSVSAPLGGKIDANELPRETESTGDPILPPKGAYSSGIPAVWACAPIEVKSAEPPSARHSRYF